ncbi:putative GTPase NOG2 [Sporobolomyces koalae]|uniref:putative GTPase NOG2 n=1 Tax=Sporobolomyces koalae TaxID=500713 RepID=UPI0031728AA0
MPPRDKSNPTTKARSSKHAAATGLKTGNIRTKGENFYRDAKSARMVNMLSGKSGRAIRAADGKIIQEAEFQSKEVTPGRVQPDRRWFGNTRTISQTALEHFREGMKEKTADPYAVVLKRNKLPLSLLTDTVSGKSIPDLTTTEPFSDTFGAKAQRKRPRLDVGSIEELAGAVASHQKSVQDAQVQAEKDQAISDLRDTEGTIAPEELKRKEEESQLGNVQQDWILGAGTSKRIWGELYKVIDSSDVLLHVLDARDPIGTRCDSVEAYLAKEKRGKKVIYVLNKVDLVPGWVAARWVKILSKTHPTIAFHASINNSFGKGSLIQLLRQFSSLFSDKKQISVGFIGYPNVGKSSIINTLKKKAVCKTAPIPGETKVWQYITLMRRIYLIDCPGIVPPSARDTESQKVLKGIVRVEHLSDPASHIQFLLDRVRKEYLARTYGVPEWDNAEDFLTKLARKTGKLQRGGEADYRTVATFVINDWIRGKIPYFVAPPEPVDAAGKPLPRPLKLGSGIATPAAAPVASTSASKLDTDAEGNTIRRLPGVSQPLHQIVHSTKFLPDDNKKIEEEDEEPIETSFVVEDDEEEWGGIASDDDDDVVEEEEDEEDFEEGDSAEPLEWDDLFANAEGALNGASADQSIATENGDDEEEEDEEEDIDIIVDRAEPAAAKSSKKKNSAGKKRNRAIDNVSSDDDEEAKPVKEARMTTNKKKATNFFTTANVKNKSRRGGPVKDQAQRHAVGQGQKGKGTGKGRRGTKSNL